MWIPRSSTSPTAAATRFALACVLNPNGHVGPLGKARPEEQIRCVNLARRGMLALKLEWFAFGELAAGSFDHNSISHLDLCGTSGVSLFYLALKKGLDVLLAHRFADPERVAVTGLFRRRLADNRDRRARSRVKAMVPNAGYSASPSGWSTRGARDLERPHRPGVDPPTTRSSPPPSRPAPRSSSTRARTTAASPPRRPGLGV